MGNIGIGYRNHCVGIGRSYLCSILVAIFLLIYHCNVRRESWRYDIYITTCLQSVVGGK